MTTDKAITVRNDAPAPLSLSEINGMADAFYKSGMFSDLKSQAQAIVKIVAGAELGLPAVYSMQNINVIRNRLTTSANGMAMLVKKSGRYNYRVTTKPDDDQKCSIKFYENGEEVGESTFTMEDAKRADLIKPDSGWVKYPRAMLFSRAISQGARIYAPDAIGGIYTDEEIRSIPPRPEETVIIEKPDDLDRLVEATTHVMASPSPETQSTLGIGQAEQDKPLPQQPKIAPPAGDGPICPIHKVVMFKKGNMKNYAHRDQSSKFEWCNGKGSDRNE